MATRLVLLCHAPTHAMREGAFASADEPLDEAGERALATYRLPVPWPRVVACSPATAARQTTKGLSLEAAIEPALADIDHGAWTGRRFADLHTAEPDGLAAWLADPAGGAPGGERLDQIADRLRPWLDAQAASDERVLAVTHPMVIRAALTEALTIPAAAALRIDIAPLTAVTLSFNGQWRLQALAPAR